MKKYKFRIYIDTGFPTADYEDEITIEAKSFKEAQEKAEEEAREYFFENVSYGYEHLKK